MNKMKFFFFFLCFFSFLVCSTGFESPQFRVLRSEYDFEIRLYKESSWMSALVPVSDNTSFEKATRSGFHRLYQYIHGNNTNSTRLSITVPILTSVVPNLHGFQYIVRIFMPLKFQEVPPYPFRDLNLQFTKLDKHCIAVRKFSGFARNNTVTKQVENLMTILGKLQNGNLSITTSYDKNGYSIAQYNASFHLTGRLNEVWMNISGFWVDGCQFDE